MKYNKKLEIVLLSMNAILCPVISSVLFINFNLNTRLYNDPEYHLLFGSLLFIFIGALVFLRIIQILQK